MIVFRLAGSKFSRDLSGKGAQKSGGRWHSKGNLMIYTGMTRALCANEIAVHTPLGIVPGDYTISSIQSLKQPEYSGPTQLYFQPTGKPFPIPIQRNGSVTSL